MCILCLANRPARSYLTSKPIPVFYIGGNVIQYVNEWPHLGHIISVNCDDANDILCRRSSLIGQINNIICNFRKVDCSTKIRLVKAYCNSLYGCELWDFSNNCIENICTAWRRGIRQVWRVPNTTHSSLLPGLCETLPLRDLFYKRMLNLVYQCLNSQSPMVNFITRHSILFGRMNSTIGRNVLSCCERYHTTINSIVNRTFLVNNIDRVVCNELEAVSNNVDMLRELIYCREGTLNLSNASFSYHDIDQLIVLACTS